VLSFQRTDLFLPGLALLRTHQGFFLFRDDTIRTVQKSFNFSFICVLDSCLHRLVLLVFAVKMEDDLSQLSNLLRHFVMSFFVHGESLKCVLYYTFV